MIVPLVIVAWLLLGWQSIGRCQSTTEPKLAKPKQVCRSLTELIQWKRKGIGSEVEFSLKAYLVYAGPSWDHFRVEHADKGATMSADLSITNQLFEIRAGTLLSFQGRGHRDQLGNVTLVAEHFENNLVSPFLAPPPAKLGPGMNGTPLYRLGGAIGKIKEVLKTRKRTLVIASNEWANFEVIQIGSNSKLSFANVGQPWWFFGCVLRSKSTNPQRALHQLDLMNESQMKNGRGVRGRALGENSSSTTDGLSSEDQSNREVQFDGVVAFSDGERNVGIIRGDQRFCIRTEFAHELHAGTLISGVGKPVKNDRLDITCYTAKFTETHPPKTDSLPIPTRIGGLAELKTMLRLPPRVQLKATVEYSVFHDTTMDLHLQSSQEKLVAQIPIGDRTHTMPFGNLAEGTEIECSGMPMRHSFDPANTNVPPRNPWWIYVASAEDIKVLNRPVMMSENGLITGAVFLVLGLLCGGFWIDRLLRRVKDGDRSLTEIDHHFQSAFGAMQCGILIVDKESRILRSNHRLSSFLGVEPTIRSRLGRYLSHMDDSIESPSSMSDLIDASIRSPDRAMSAEVPMRDLKRTMRVFTCPIEMNIQNGQTRLWLFEDISEKRQLESELFQSQKMDAVGRLSGGIAHDFNNLLMVIQSSLGMIREDLCDPNNGHDHDGLKSAELAVKRASELTQQLLGFARRQRLEKKRVNAVSLVEDVEVLASRIIEARQSFIVEKQCDEVLVYVDPGRIEQALFNLCINAIDVTKHEGGCVKLTIASCDDPTYGPSARFSIVDNGPGIRRNDRQSIYDPFFTTKPPGQGTGLGLSVALGIVEQHGGRIDCHSNTEQSTLEKESLEQGTRFDIILPALSKDMLIIEQLQGEDEGTERIDSPSRSVPLSILVVEDDPGIRVASCSILERLGHQVESVENAMMAIQRLAYKAPDLVLLDLVLPEMSGVEAYREIRSAWPDLPILFCSGHIDAKTMIKDGCYPDTPPLLPKPFTRDQLESSLDSLINANPLPQDDESLAETCR